MAVELRQNQVHTAGMPYDWWKWPAGRVLPADYWTKNKPDINDPSTHYPGAVFDVDEDSPAPLPMPEPVKWAVRECALIADRDDAFNGVADAIRTRFPEAFDTTGIKPRKLYKCSLCPHISANTRIHSLLVHPGESVTYTRNTDAEIIMGCYDPTPGPVIYEPVSPSASDQEQNR